MEKCTHRINFKRYNSLTAYTPTIPNFYQNAYSQEQIIKTLCKEIQQIIDYNNEQTQRINLNSEHIAALEMEFEKFKQSGFLDYYKQLLLDYVRDNGEWIIKSLLGFQVYFGLTQDGYFTAFSPESWNDIRFDTGAVYGTEEYGRLILSY